ncbi:MAG: flagellar biosynthesis protein FlhA [Bryobacteraceae bacterium]
MTAPVVSSPAAVDRKVSSSHSLSKAESVRAAAREHASAGWQKLAPAEFVVPIAVLGILLAMVTPLPAFILDILISANITLSTIILLVSMNIRRPVDFSVFPTLLLLMTLFRLALNVSSSRLILLNGAHGTSAAGEVIQSFGGFVVGGSFVIGVVMFLVLIAIQYVVINHGAVRISEVTARFTLDALPGKQMSIDADLNAGLTNEAEAKQRRKALASEAEFYGAMDGATRFTQRDAVASILITSINIVAGFLIGVIQHGMELSQALQTYTVLTIGDGLVTVIPALMISISGGLIVTRASSDRDMGSDVHQQVFSSPKPLFLASGVLLLMAILPGMPKIPFLVFAGGVAWVGRRLQRVQEGTAAATEPAAVSAHKDNLEALLQIEPLAVELGLGLVKFAEGGANSPLLRRISVIRKQTASELGYILPPVRVTDNLSLRAREYAVLVRGTEVARFELPPNSVLVIPAPDGKAPQEGVATKEPAFGMEARWVPSEAGDAARSAGCTVVDPLSVLGTHLSELFRRFAHELFTRQDAKRLLDRFAEENPRAVEDLVPKLLPLSTVQRVLQNLLRERVTIRDGVAILESLSEAAAVTRNPVLLTDYVRQSLRRSVVKPFLSQEGSLPALIADLNLEHTIEQAVEHQEFVSHCNLAPQQLRVALEAAKAATARHGSNFAVITSAGARYFLRQIVESQFPGISVFSHSEIPAGVKVISLGSFGRSE